MRLEAHQAVNYMAAGLFQAPRPQDVVFLIKACLKLHQHRHLLAIFGCTRQGCNNGTIAAYTVQRLLNRQHLRVIRRSAHQLNNGVKAFVRVVQKNVTCADSGKQITVIRQLQRTLRHKWLVQPRPHPGHTDKLKEAGRVQRAVNLVNLHVRNIQVFFQKSFYPAVVGFEQLQTHRRTTLALAQRFFYLLQQVDAVLLVQLQVAVTRYAEGNHVQNMAALKQIIAMAGNNIL